MLTVQVTSERKGSNPGGRCVLPYRGDSLEAYIKYCDGVSRLPPTQPLVGHNQPIYEAITLVLAQRMGLNVPLYFLLMNSDRNLDLEYDLSIPRHKYLNSYKHCYLISRLVSLPQKEDLTKLEAIMGEEQLYRDLVMLGDVLGRKQNYALIEPEGQQPYLLYIDLGCSFVDAHGGILSQRKHVSKLVRDNGGKPLNDLGKRVRNAHTYLRRYGIFTNHENESDQDILVLSELINELPDLLIPIFPNGNRKVRTLLSSREIGEIQVLLALNMEKVLKAYRKSFLDSPLLIHS